MVTPASAHTPEHAIYKPNARSNGGAVRFGLNVAKEAVFVEAANQSGPKQFDWERKIIMKWGLADLGIALAVLQGRQMEAKIFHKTARANSAVDLSAQNDPKRAPYLFSISRQEVEGTLRRVVVPITHAEAAVLESLFRVTVVRLIGW